MDLNKVVASARALELAKREVDFLKTNTINPNKEIAMGAYAVSSESRRKDKERRRDRDIEEQRNTRKTIEICRYCGERVPHNTRCKARNAMCDLCNKIGHFARVCESADQPIIETDGVLNQEQAENSNQYLSTLVDIDFLGQKVIMKVDSGAEANIISHRTYNILPHHKPPLKPSTAKLKPYGSPLLKIKGQFKAKLKANGKETDTTIYVTSEKNTPSLMSKYTAFDLGILNITVDQHQGARNHHTNKPTNTQHKGCFKVHTLKQPDRRHVQHETHTFETPDLQQVPFKSYTFEPPDSKKEQTSETFQMYHVRHIKSHVKQTKPTIAPQHNNLKQIQSTQMETKGWALFPRNSKKRKRERTIS